MAKAIRTQPWFKVPFISKRGRFYFRQIFKKVPIEDNPFVNGQFEYYQGSNYFYLNRKAILKIIDPRSEIKCLINFYRKYVVASPKMHPCPQETIIQTFLGGQKDIVIQKKNYRFIDWKDVTG